MPDPKKVQAIKQMQAPSTRQEFQSLLGMVNYLSQFALSMYNLTTLQKLLKGHSSSMCGNLWEFISEAEGQHKK